MSDLTQGSLKDVLRYDPNTGVFVWLVSTNGKIKVGDTAGHHDSYGYSVITIDYKAYKSHRLAFLYVYGRMPNGEIDHINCIKDDNSINNLRECSRKQNAANIKKRRDNSSGFKGVTKSKKEKKWRAAIEANGKSHYLGYYDNPVDAHKAYKNAAIEMCGEFYRAT